MHYCSNFFEANLLLTAVTFLGVTVTVTAVNFFVNAEGYEYDYFLEKIYLILYDILQFLLLFM